jgi:hypothetical protein
MVNEPIRVSEETLRTVYLPGHCYKRGSDRDYLLFATRYDLTLTDVELVKEGYDRSLLNGVMYLEDNNFEAWFYDHCMKRMVRPVGAMEEFRLSNDAEVRGIAIKALKDRYGVTEADRLSAQMAQVNESISSYAFWTMLAAGLSALAALVSCGASLCK